MSSEALRKLSFPKKLSQPLSGLVARGFMSPNYLSQLIISGPILPARLNSRVAKNRPLNPEDFLGSWFRRTFPDIYDFYKLDKNEQLLQAFLQEQNITPGLTDTHSFTPLFVEGLETLEARHNHNLPEYEITFCGNGQDAMKMDIAKDRINANPNKNHLFWNYPGVGSSKGAVRCEEDLFRAGYLQVRRLLEKGILAKNITLYGYSLGGSVAVHVARQLRDEGHLVNITLDRSFADAARVMPISITNQFAEAWIPSTDENDVNKKILPLLPIVSSVISLALAGIFLGTVLAGLIASLSLVMTSTVAALAYTAALSLKIVGILLEQAMNLVGHALALPCSLFSKTLSDNIQSLFYNIGYYLAHSLDVTACEIYEVFSSLAIFMDKAINLFGSVVGGVVALSGLLIGAFAGLIAGMLLCIPLLWSGQAASMPMTPFFYAAVYSLCCPMNSLKEMRLLCAKNPELESLDNPQITVINTMDDKVILVGASLLSGLKFAPDEASNVEEKSAEPSTRSLINCIWYQRGGHQGQLKNPIVGAEEAEVHNPLLALKI